MLYILNLLTATYHFNKSGKKKKLLLLLRSFPCYSFIDTASPNPWQPINCFPI